MPENRQYAGPHDAAELLIDSDRYALVVRNDLSDEAVSNLGYTFDGDEAVAQGLALAVRTITVSDELGLKLDGAGFDDPESGEWIDSWPKVGGTPAAQTVDVPESNPATMPLTLEDGTELTSAEADERAYQAAEVAEVVERLTGEGSDVEPAAALRASIATIDERRVEIENAITRDGELTDGDEDKLTGDELEALHAELERLVRQRVETVETLKGLRA